MHDCELLDWAVTQHLDTRESNGFADVVDFTDAFYASCVVIKNDFFDGMRPQYRAASLEYEKTYEYSHIVYQRKVVLQTCEKQGVQDEKMDNLYLLDNSSLSTQVYRNADTYFQKTTDAILTRGEDSYDVMMYAVLIPIRLNF